MVRMVRKQTYLCFGLLCALLVLTGCVGKVGSVCFGNGSAGPPKVSQGPVIISTDHTVYAPSDTIIVTITNTLDTTIYIRSAPGCPTLVLRRKVDGDWRAIYLCQKSEAAPGIWGYTIPAHTSGADNLPISGLPATLADGTYRVGLPYSTNKPASDPRAPLQSGVIAWSAAFQVCTCRSC